MEGDLCKDRSGRGGVNLRKTGSEVEWQGGRGKVDGGEEERDRGGEKQREGERGTGSASFLRGICSGLAVSFSVAVVSSSLS